MIYDADDNPIAGFFMVMGPGDVATMTIKADALAGYSLRADAVLYVAVEARLSGDVPWTNLETTPIDLGPHAPGRPTFEIRLTATATPPAPPDNRRAFSVRVAR